MKLIWIDDQPMPKKFDRYVDWYTVCTKSLCTFRIDWCVNEFRLTTSNSLAKSYGKNLDELKRRAEDLYERYLMAVPEYEELYNRLQAREAELLETSNRYLEKYRECKALLVKTGNLEIPVSDVTTMIRKGTLPSIYKNQ